MFFYGQIRVFLEGLIRIRFFLKVGSSFSPDSNTVKIYLDPQPLCMIIAILSHGKYMYFIYDLNTHFCLRVEGTMAVLSFNGMEDRYTVWPRSLDHFISSIYNGSRLLGHTAYCWRSIAQNITESLRFS